MDQKTNKEIIDNWNSWKYDIYESNKSTWTDKDDSILNLITKIITNANSNLDPELLRLKSLLMSKDLDLKAAEEVRLSHAKKISYLQAELRKLNGKRG